jgi:hypothetical protein
MLYKTTDFPPEDFMMYFRNNLIRLVGPDGKAEWVRYDGADGPRQQFRRAREDSSIFLLDKTTFKKYKVDVRFPFGFFNTKTSVVLCERIGQRQNNKGLMDGVNFSASPMETIVYKAVKGEEMDMKIAYGIQWAVKQFSLTPSLANFMFEESRYVPLTEAMIQIRSRKAFARALSPSLALVPHHQCKDFMVFYHDLPVAELLSKDKKVKVLVKDFHDELTNLLAHQPHRNFRTSTRSLRIISSMSSCKQRSTRTTK